MGAKKAERQGKARNILVNLANNCRRQKRIPRKRQNILKWDENFLHVSLCSIGWRNKKNTPLSFANICENVWWSPSCQWENAVLENKYELIRETSFVSFTWPIDLANFCRPSRARRGKLDEIVWWKPIVQTDTHSFSHPYVNNRSPSDKKVKKSK